MQTAWLRGNVAPDAEAAVRATRGVYETLRWQEGAPPGLPHHEARWHRGRQLLRLPPLPLALLLAEAQPLLRAQTAWRVRLTAYLGGEVELALRPLHHDESQPTPWRLATVQRDSWRRDPDCKTTDLRHDLALRHDAQRLGADEALLTAPDGQWAEATTANLLVGLNDGRLTTPWHGSGALPGTTLAQLSEMLPIAPMRLDADILPRVKWALLTNAIALLRPVLAIDATHLSTPPREVSALAARLHRASLSIR